MRSEASGGTITTMGMPRASCVHMQLASAPFTALRVSHPPVRDPPYHRSIEPNLWVTPPLQVQEKYG